MAATRRLQKELGQLQSLKLEQIVKIDVNDSDLYNWKVSIHPKKAPYEKGTFVVAIKFPTDYPFGPPKINLDTKIFHPNIREDGEICLPILSKENWKPNTFITTVLEALTKLIEEPDAAHPLRTDVADVINQSKSEFMKIAEQYTEKYAKTW